jgi:DNA-binding winged helix-turn-helix (wHTH) protein
MVQFPIEAALKASPRRSGFGQFLSGIGWQSCGGWETMRAFMVIEGGAVMAPLRFGEFVLDEAGFELLRKGRPVSIEPRALKLLLHLARNRQRAVPRAELAAILWPDHVVSDTSLKEAVNLARRAVGDTAGAQAVVATLRGHGYRFVAAVEEWESQDVDAATATAARRPTGPGFKCCASCWCGRRSPPCASVPLTVWGS